MYSVLFTPFPSGMFIRQSVFCQCVTINFENGKEDFQPEVVNLFFENPSSFCFEFDFQYLQIQGYKRIYWPINLS